jgi:hypothetical protein
MAKKCVIQTAEHPVKSRIYFFWKEDISILNVKSGTVLNNFWIQYISVSKPSVFVCEFRISSRYVILS